VIPHPLFHILTFIVLENLPPEVDFKAAGYIVGVGFYLLIGAVLYSVYVRPVFAQGAAAAERVAAVAITLALMLVAPVNFFSIPEGHLYWGYFLPNIHMNPTLTALKPFALLVFPFAVAALAGRWRGALPALLAAMLTVLGMLGKPNYAMALLPALGLIGLYRLVRREPLNWPLLLSIGLPAVALLGGQYLLYNNSTVGGLSGGSMVFSPFAQYIERGTTGLPFKLVLSVIFPLAVTIAYWRDARRDLALILAWLTFAVGVFIAYSFVESARILDGNFIWGAHISVTVLFATMTTFYLRRIYTPGAGFQFDRAGWLVGLAFVLHLAGGVVWYWADSVSPGFVWY
jgi:hypothetical protein